jgi:hypothetical protein
MIEVNVVQNFVLGTLEILVHIVASEIESFIVVDCMVEGIFIRIVEKFPHVTKQFLGC